MKQEKEKIAQQIQSAKLQLEQAKHREQKLLNRMAAIQKKGDKARTHHLCNMGGAIQSISKEADSLTRVGFYSLMENVFALPEVQALVADAVKEQNGGES